MKKLALFVEGQTEQLFAQRLIETIAGKHHVHIETVKAQGGSAVRRPRRFLPLNAYKPSGARYYVLICDSSGDHSVVTDLCEQHKTLSEQGYQLALGLRDVFPASIAEAPRMAAAMQKVLPTKGLTARILLSIAEVEAWFVAEETHYLRIHANLTEDKVAAVLGDAPEAIDVEQLPQPSETLKRIYQAVGMTYAKDRRRVERTVDALDCARMYSLVAPRVPALSRLCQEIDLFLG